MEAKTNQKQKHYIRLIADSPYIKHNELFLLNKRKENPKLNRTAKMLRKIQEHNLENCRRENKHLSKNRLKIQFIHE